MVFAQGGPDAVEEVRRSTFDVVITDMRMPEIDGAAVLLEVRDHDPTTFRAILTGFADHKAVTRALPLAHRFFNKPCDVATLAATVDQAVALRLGFANPALRAIIARVVRAGSGEALGDDDPARAARILQIATSALLGFEGPRSADPASPRDREITSALALAAYARAALERPIEGFETAELQRHAHEIAQRAQAAAAGKPHAIDAFTAGLVHDVGKIVLAIALPEEHAAIAREVARSGQHRTVVERELLGATHADLAAFVLTCCSLPLDVIEAVAVHDRDLVPQSPIADALRAAHTP